jgi:UDP-N-acetylglucosamine acyltransferase
MAIDPSAMIAPTARIHPDAVIGPQTAVGEYCVIERDVSIGAFCRLEPYVYVKRWTTPGERSYLRIGCGNRIREHYTISRGTAPESATTIGDGNYIMTSGHIAHNCRIGNNVVICSCALVAGQVEIEDQAFISGGIGIHQYTRIGRLAMVAGMSRVNLDLAPFFLYGGYHMRPMGLNLVGLERAGFSREDIAALKRAYRILFRTRLKVDEALARIESEVPSEHTRHLATFVRASQRGICREAKRAGL